MNTPLGFLEGGQCSQCTQLTDVYRIATRLLAVEREVKDDLEALAKIHKDFGDLLMMLGDELARLADYVETLSGEEDDAGV